MFEVVTSFSRLASKPPPSLTTSVSRRPPPFAPIVQSWKVVDQNGRSYQKCVQAVHAVL